MTTEKLLTVNQASAALAVGRTTFYELLKRGDIRAVKLGGATRVPASEIDRLIAEAQDWKGAA